MQFIIVDSCTNMQFNRVMVYYYRVKKPEISVDINLFLNQILNMNIATEYYDTDSCFSWKHCSRKAATVCNKVR